MRVKIDHERAVDRHPELTAQIMVEVSGWLAKERLRALDLSEMIWVYDFTRRTSSENPAEGLCVVLEGTFRRRWFRTSTRFFQRQISLPLSEQEPTPSTMVPIEIVEEMREIINPTLKKPSEVEHACRFVYVDTLLHRTIDCLALGGFRDPDGRNFIIYADASHLSKRELASYRLLQVEGATAEDSFSLLPGAAQRFENAGIGENFLYNKEDCTKMSFDEIREIAKDRKFGRSGTGHHRRKY